MNPHRGATVFWDGDGHYWSADGLHRHGPFKSTDSLDDAIKDAHQHGFKIEAVNVTRGGIPAHDRAPKGGPA